MLPWLQIGGVNSIIVEAIPLLELLLCELVSVLRVPVQHALVEVQTDGGAVLFHDTLWVIQQIVGIDDADLDFAFFGHVAVLLAADRRTDHSSGLQVIEETAECSSGSS